MNSKKDNLNIFEDFAHTFELSYLGLDDDEWGRFQDNEDSGRFTVVPLWLAERILEMYQENLDGG